MLKCNIMLLYILIKCKNDKIYFTNVLEYYNLIPLTFKKKNLS